MCWVSYTNTNPEIIEQIYRTMSQARPGDPGFTCCQDADLLNPTSKLSERIDLVLFRGNFSAIHADIVGDNPANRTSSGLWPSDHAGVVATLQFSTANYSS